MDNETFDDFKQLDGVPDFVKEASLDDLEDISRSGFAGGNTDYPIYKKAAAWMSTARYGEDATDDPLIEEELRKAARVHGFSFEDASEALQEEPDEPDYLLEKEADGETIRLMPVAGVNNLKDAACYLHRNRDKMPYEWRKEAAQKILARANEEEIDLPHRDYLSKAAGYGISHPEQVKEAFRVRAHLVDDDLRHDLLRCADSWSDGQDIDDYEKCAQVLARVDEEHDLRRFYGGVLNLPEEEACSITKQAAERELENSVALANGDVIYRDDVDRQSMSKAAAAVGGEFADGLPVIPDWTSFKQACQDLDPGDSETVSTILS